MTELLEADRIRVKGCLGRQTVKLTGTVYSIIPITEPKFVKTANNIYEVRGQRGTGELAKPATFNILPALVVNDISITKQFLFRTLTIDRWPVNVVTGPDPSDEGIQTRPAPWESGLKSFVDEARAAVAGAYPEFTTRFPMEITMIKTADTSFPSITYAATFFLSASKTMSATATVTGSNNTLGQIVNDNTDNSEVTVGSLQNVLGTYTEWPSTLDYDLGTIVKTLKLAYARCVLRNVSTVNKQPCYDFYDKDGNRICLVGAISKQKII